MSKFQRRNQEPKEFEEKVIQISRVTKKTKGGNKMGFSVLMVVGDKKGKVGIGLGKAPDVVSAIKKGIKKAKKKMIMVPLDGTTIPFEMRVKKGAGKVLLKPAPKGTGVIAGGPVRALVEVAGVRDISAKILGSENKASSVYAAFYALQKIEQIVSIRGIKLRSIIDIENEEKEKLKQLQEQAKATAKEGEKKTAKKEVKKPVVEKKPVKKVIKKKVVKKAPAKKAVK
jgi:small subunit ribosomal protein S5